MTDVRPQPLIPGLAGLGVELLPSSDGRPSRKVGVMVAALAAGLADPSADARREAAAKAAFAEKFGALAQDKAGFHDFMKQVFGDNYDVAKAESFRQAALKGDFSWLPPVKFVDSATLNGANGAYDQSTGTVLLNEELSPSLAAETYVEEAAHHLDAQLNKTDTKGDEGELFRRLISGENLSAAQIQEIRDENDKGVITVDGRQIEVEFWNPFKAIGKAIKSVGKAIGKAVEGVVEGIGSAIKGVGKGIGQFFTGIGQGIGGFFGNLFKGRIGDAFGALWSGLDTAFIKSSRSILEGVWTGAEQIVSGATHLIPFVGKYVRKATDRIMDAGRSLVTGAFDVASSAVRNVVEGGGQFLGGLGKFFTGDFKGGLKDMGVGLLKTFVQTPIDALLLGLGKGVSAIQTLVGLEPVGRKLTDEEIRVLRQVYGDSIDYDQVRIKEGFSGIWSANDRAFVHGNTVYMKDNVIDEHLLVHEMAHVWQFQNGGSDYMSEALTSQWWGNGYDWEKSVPGTPFEELEPEQQAELLADAYASGFFDGTGKRFIRGGVDYTDYLLDALEKVQSGQGAP